jgi:hypothetical protein
VGGRRRAAHGLLEEMEPPAPGSPIAGAETGKAVPCLLARVALSGMATGCSEVPCSDGYLRISSGLCVRL